MTLEPTSLLTVSIGTLVVLLGVVVSASVTWTRLRVQLETLARDMRAMRSWHHTEVDSLTAKHHDLRTQVHDLEIRTSVLESRSVRTEDTGPHDPIPRRVRGRDRTPPPVDVVRRRDPEDSGAT